MTEFVTVQELSCLHVPDRTGLEEFIPGSLRSKTSVSFIEEGTGELMVRFPNNRGVQMFYLSPNERLDFVAMQIVFDQTARPRFLLFESMVRREEFNVQIVQASERRSLYEYMEMVANANTAPLIGRDETLLSTFEGTDVRFYIPSSSFRPYFDYDRGMLKETTRLTDTYWRPEIQDILDHLKNTKTD